MTERNQSTELADEKKYFDEVLEVIRKQGIEAEAQVNRRINVEGYDAHHVIAAHRVGAQAGEQLLARLEKAYDEPYFARMNYTDESGRDETIYIGKVMQIEDGDKYYVTDWRKPIANLFYSKHLRNVSMGERRISVELKRRFDIRDGKFFGYSDIFDSDISGEHYDENLAALLKRNAGTHLKDIISTIQENQNIIIRRPLNTSIKIQGVAGSGKTSVVLHRLSYLMYDGELAVEDCLLVLPNPIFRNYLARILPELEIDRIAAMTTTEIAGSVWDELWAIKPRFKTYDYELEVINRSEKQDDDYLNGYRYFNSKKAIDDIIMSYNLFVEKELGRYVDRMRLTADDSRVEKGLLILLRRLAKKMQARISGAKIERFNSISRISYQQFLDEIQLELAGLGEYYEVSLSQYARATGRSNDNLKLLHKLERECKALEISNVEKFYQQLLKYIGDVRPEYSRYLKYKQNNLNNKKLAREDVQLCAVLALNVFRDRRWYNRYKNIVIDEVQDISELEMYLLCLLNKDQLFTIAGDENQGIFNYRNVNEWRGLDYIRDHFSQTYVEPHFLNVCYRSTAAITEVCNAIAGTEIKAVFDNGRQVNFCALAKNQSVAAEIIRYAEKYRAGGCKTIAVIPKYKLESDKLYAELVKIDGQTINYINGTQDKFVEGITLVSTPNAKGLEFDAVIIPDASAAKFDMDNNIDRRLLYVAASRALSNLAVISSGKPVECLSGYFRGQRIRKN